MRRSSSHHARRAVGRLGDCTSFMIQAVGRYWYQSARHKDVETTIQLEMTRTHPNTVRRGFRTRSPWTIRPEMMSEPHSGQRELARPVRLYPQASQCGVDPRRRGQMPSLSSITPARISAEAMINSVVRVNMREPAFPAQLCPAGLPKRVWPLYRGLAAPTMCRAWWLRQAKPALPADKPQR